MKDINVFDEKAPSKPRVIRLQFGQPFKQVGPNELEIEVKQMDFPTFTEQLVETVYEAMGTNKGEAFLDDMANEILRKVILDGVR